MENKPVIGGNGSSVLHLLPLRPRLDFIFSHIPDSLAPDDIFEMERGAVVHHPFGDGFSRRCPHLRWNISISQTSNDDKKEIY